MANTFISYSRENESITESLVEDIEDLGHTAWFDNELSGGQEWWQKILESIRNCDIFIFVLSNDSLNSTACTLEYEYANALGKTIIPVLVSEGVSPNLLPPALSKIQFIDYQMRDKDAVLHLAKSFTMSPSSADLPDPLPTPPEVPLSYLGGFVKQINTTSTLSYEEQIILVAKLKRSLTNPDNSHDAQTLLRNLRKRPDLLANIADEIDELLKKNTHIQSLKTREIIDKKSNKPFLKSPLFMYIIIVALFIGSYNYIIKPSPKPWYEEGDIPPSEPIIEAPVITNDKISNTTTIKTDIAKKTKNTTGSTPPNKSTTKNSKILNKYDADYWFNKGFGFYSLKRYKEAITAYNKSIELAPDSVGAYLNKGLSLDNLKRYDEAITAYDKAIALNPKYALAFYNKGIVLYKTQRYVEAITAFNKAIAIDPNYLSAINYKGMSQEKLKNYKEAIATYEKAITIDPKFIYPIYNKGLALYNIKLYDDALTTFNKALAIDPNYLSAINNKGLSLENLKRYDEAIDAYNQAISIDPNFDLAINNKGLILYKIKRYKEAILAYDKVLAIKPNNANTHYNKGLALAALTHYNEAILSFDKALVINPRDFEAYYQKALVYALLNNKKMLLLNLEKAIKGNYIYKNMAKKNKDFKKYWKDKNFKNLVGNMTKDNEDSKIIESKPSKQYFYICYDKKTNINNTQEIFYEGCKIFNSNCQINKKEHFGQYLTNEDTNAAYNRCISSTPLLNSSIDELMKQGKSYYHGTANKPIDYSKAKKYFLQASKKNSVDAYRYLGTMYLFGHGVSVDKKQAEKWLKKAIGDGDEKAKKIYTKYFKKIQNSKNKILTLNENGIEISIYYPQNIQAGEAFILKATMSNHNSTARMGGLTLSFPHLNSILYKNIKNTFDSLKYYEAPTKLYSSIQKRNIHSKYLMIEGWQKKWSYDKMKTFSIQLVAPKNILQLLVNVRGVLHVGSSKHNKREIVIPAYSTSTDQQGYYTSQFKITINQ